MITSFGDAATEDLYHARATRRLRRFPADLHRVALRKLAMLDAAVRLEDLRAPPANRLEVLRGGLKGLHSIRVNDQWRIVFAWENGKAGRVSLTDYH